MNDIQNQPITTQNQSVNQPQIDLQQSTPPNSPIAEVKKAKNIQTIILVILLMISLGVGGYFAYIYYQKSEQQTSETPITQTAPSPTPTPDPTANWQTYSNSVQGITFKYSPLWSLVEKEGQVEQGTTYNTQVQLQQNEAKITMVFNMDGIGGQGQTYQGQPFNLDGNNLFRFVKTNSYDNTQMVGISTSLTNTLGVFEVNGKTYSIILAYPVSDSQTEIGNSLEKEFDQILSTFKFTN